MAAQGKPEDIWRYYITTIRTLSLKLIFKSGSKYQVGKKVFIIFSPLDSNQQLQAISSHSNFLVNQKEKSEIIRPARQVF